MAMQEYDSEFMETLYYNPQTFEIAGGLWPLRLGRNVAKPNYHAGPRRIDVFSIHFVMNGSVELLYDETRETLEKGDLFCLFPGVTYIYRIAASSKPLELVWLAFDGPQATGLLEMAGIAVNKPYLRGAVSKQAEATLEDIRGALAASNGNKSVLQLISSMYRLFLQITSDEGPATDRPGAAEWIRKSINFMNVHYSEQLSVADVADYIGVDRSHFTRTFSDTMGMPPVKYLQKLRMEAASGMLRSSAMSVTEISLSVGYPDLYSFTRAFRNYYGLPPSRYRGDSAMYN